MKFNKILSIGIDENKIGVDYWKRIDALTENKVIFQKDDITFIFDHSDEMVEEDLKKLLPYKNCIVYPPIAYVSKEAALNKQEMFTSNLEKFAIGEQQNVVK